MAGLQYCVEPTGLTHKLLDLLNPWGNNPRVSAVLLLAADGNSWKPQDLECFKHFKKPILGGVFPQIMHGEHRMSKGTIAIALNETVKWAVIEHISSDATQFDEALLKAFPQAPNKGTMFVFVDGFSRRVGSLIDAVFDSFGLSINYLGGGAGSLSLQQKPCLITSEGLVQDAAVLVWTDQPSGIGVSHGWAAISQPFRVTEAQGNVIISLDWKPALEAYRAIVERHAQQLLSPEHFFEVAKAYPFGIAKISGELVVRDPIRVEGNNLVCVGEVAVGSFVFVLHGDDGSLIQAAFEANQQARHSLQEQKLEPSLEIFVDCISRMLFLQNRFGEEIRAARAPNVPLVGISSIGEIANSGNDYLEFYNKTAVVALM